MEPITIFVFFIILVTGQSPYTAWIINGEYAPPQLLPFYGFIQARETSTGRLIRCGASLIGSRWGITAGHCVVKARLNDDILFGINNVYRGHQDYQIARVKNYILHPDYKGPGFADVALIEFEKPTTHHQLRELSCTRATNFQ